jgi:diketogulonate reductase-like aldo/keto reductase
VTCHAREAFKGKRIVYAALAQGEKPIALKQPSLSLTSGDTMPSAGLGLWKLPNADCQKIVHKAIQNGYRLLDSAAIYGNEIEVGLGIKQALDEGVIKREELFVTSKLWNTYHRKEHVRDACLKTLTDLGLEYLDLYLVHFPIALKFVPFEKRYPPGWIYDPEAIKPAMEEDIVPFHETWAAMEKLVEEGLVRNIGVSNMGTSLLRDLCNYAVIKPSVLQVEMHPYLTQEKLLRFCREKGIAVTAYSSFGAGSYIELGMAAKEESCLEE